MRISDWSSDVCSYDLTTRHPKMDLTNGRSMELLARLGVVDILRAAGVPSGNCFDIVRVSHGLPGVGKELFRFAYPSPDEVRRMSRETNDGTLAREQIGRAHV